MHEFDFRKVASKVFKLLLDNPRCRDDDRFLFCEVWKEELSKTPESGKLSHPETIRRARQKLQEKHESLRGEKWEDRHNMQGAICEQLSFI